MRSVHFTTPKGNELDFSLMGCGGTPFGNMQTTLDDEAAVLAGLDGQLTASLMIDEDDYDMARTLVPILEGLAGRLIVNNWPTGVEVGSAMVHGGPYPATSDSRTTSVGTLSIDRFLRPICYQNFPAELLPGAF